MSTTTTSNMCVLCGWAARLANKRTTNNWRINQEFTSSVRLFIITEMLGARPERWSIRRIYDQASVCIRLYGLMGAMRRPPCVEISTSYSLFLFLFTKAGYPRAHFTTVSSHASLTGRSMTSAGCFDIKVRTVATELGSRRLRSVVAKRRIHRGERLALIPSQHVLCGEVAANRLLPQLCAQLQLPKGRADALIAHIAASPLRTASLTSGLFPFFSRDAWLLTAVVYLLRCVEGKGCDARVHEFSTWVGSWPKSVPPLSSHLHSSSSLCGDTEGVSPPTHRSAADRRQRLLADALQHGIYTTLEANGEQGAVPSSPRAASPAMKQAFFYRHRYPLNSQQRQHALQGPAAILADYSSQCLVELEGELERALHSLTSLLPTLPSALQRPREGEEEGQLRLLSWAHFMLRSRGVNLPTLGEPSPGREQQRQLAVIPVVDLFNHSASDFNVTYSSAQEDNRAAGVVVTALKEVREGEELTLHYGNSCQRGTGPAAAPPVATRRMLEGEIAPEVIRSRESREEFLGVAPLPGRQQAPASTQVLKQLSKALRGSCTSVSHAEREAGRVLLEAQEASHWLWRYGFQRSREELLTEASLQWSSSLQQRIAHLTDVRRRGRPGEFVVGVPEGLAYLRDQRLRLERERYGSRTVFPPQRA